MADSRQYVIWAFKLRGCVDCGWRPETMEDLRRLECDHRDPATKVRVDSGTVRDLSRGTSLTHARRYGLPGLLDELWKCDPVCRPCHIKRGRDRRRPGQLSLELEEWLAEPVPAVPPGGIQDTLGEDFG